MLDANTIQGQLIINDPKVFQKPWVQEPQKFQRMSDESVVSSGWKGLFSGATDGVCAPINDVDDFDRRVKVPAARGLVSPEEEAEAVREVTK